MTKERRTVTLEESVDRYLGRDGVNASELVNKLVKHHMKGGQTEESIRRFRLEQLKSEAQSLESRAEQKRKELEMVKKAQQRADKEKKANREEVIDDAAEKLTPDRWLKGASKREQIPGPESEEVAVVYEKANVDMDKATFYNDVVDRILD